MNFHVITKQADFPWPSVFVQAFIHCVSCSVCGPWLQNFNESHAEFLSEPASQRCLSHWEIPCVPLPYCFVLKFKSILTSYVSLKILHMADKLYILEDVLFSLHAKISNSLRNLVNYITQRQHWSWSTSICSRAFTFLRLKS